MKIGSIHGSGPVQTAHQVPFHDHDHSAASAATAANPALEGYKKFTTPEVFGPGLWFAIHLEGKRSVGDLKKNFPGFMANVVKNIRCETCNGHASAYLSSHPIEPYFDKKNEKGEEIGCFLWTWEFHNTVNARLNKQIIDFQTAYDMFSDPGSSDEFTVCDTTCGDHGEAQGQGQAKKEEIKKSNANMPLFFRLKSRGL